MNGSQPTQQPQLTNEQVIATTSAVFAEFRGSLQEHHHLQICLDRIREAMALLHTTEPTQS